MESQFLPIGSVVQLKNSTACVMIAGYLPTGPSRPGYVWDYSGMKFPLGYVADNEIYCFDQDQIETVHALGYQDQEQFAFIRSMNYTAEKIKAETMAREGQNQQ
ncbi:MAG: DUF4176 domain-containing protein [Lachnospiraceae bacterium]|nr:DUF4176 domain-containing protein [Lachnospiraceae bacterium]